MLKRVARIVRWLAIALCLIVFRAWATEPLLDALARRGWFGSCFEGACGYAAAYIYWPLMTLGLTLASLLALASVKGRRSVRP